MGTSYLLVIFEGRTSLGLMMIKMDCMFFGLLFFIPRVATGTLIQYTSSFVVWKKSGFAFPLLVLLFIACYYSSHHQHRQ